MPVPLLRRRRPRSRPTRHPLGPALLDRLSAAPGHAAHAGRAEAGVHVDPGARRVGWWLTGIVPHAGRTAATGSRAGPRGDVRAGLVAALPHAVIGQGFGPAVTQERAAAVGT
ncbi:hypothetical protein [Streptomyces sp. NRRL S-448]|uniref:hypothetical protein n=1 Tax=Streptomyces sp. NRRL S-448 TaxID=1463907 RepID=UPI0035633436